MPCISQNCSGSYDIGHFIDVLVNAPLESGARLAGANLTGTTFHFIQSLGF